MARELLLVLVLVLVALIIGLVVSLLSFIKEHGFFTLIWRHLSGMPWDGQHLNDAGLLTHATDRRAHTPTGRVRRFYTLPRLHRAARRIGRYVLLAVLSLIWIRYPTPWAAVYSSEVVFPFAAVAVIVGRIRWQDRKHYRTWVQPLHLATAHQVGLPAASDPRSWLAIEPDRSKVVASLPAGFAPKDHDGDYLVGTIISKLGLESPEVKWSLAGPAPRLTITASKPPPELVGLADVRDAIDRVRPDVLVWGPGKNDSLITTSLSGDSPHIGLSMGSGAGKSRTARWLLAQMLYRGAISIVLDVKMVSQHWAAWSGALPNVIIARSAAEIHAVLIWLAVELERRNTVAMEHADAEGDVPAHLQHLIGPRIVVCAEELNAAAKVLRAYWTKRRTKDDPTRSPALDALDSLSLMGRQARINVIYIGQRLSVRATGGDGDARENIGVIGFGRYSPSNWKMLAPDFPMPPKCLTPGRLQVVSDKVQECQAPLVTALEARDLAMAGSVGVFPAEAPGHRVIAGRVEAIETSDQGLSHVTAPVSPVLSPGPVTLSEAVKYEVVGCSLYALRQARYRGQLPDHIGLRGSAQTWDAEELRRWDLARRLRGLATRCHRGPIDSGRLLGIAAHQSVAPVPALPRPGPVQRPGVEVRHPDLFPLRGAESTTSIGYPPARPRPLRTHDAAQRRPPQNRPEGPLTMTLTPDQRGRMARAREVIRETSKKTPPMDEGELLSHQAARIGKLQYWLEDMLDMLGQLDQPDTTVTPMQRKYGG